MWIGLETMALTHSEVSRKWQRLYSFWGRLKRKSNEYSGRRMMEMEKPVKRKTKEEISESDGRVYSAVYCDRGRWRTQGKMKTDNLMWQETKNNNHLKLANVSKNLIVTFL